MRRHPCRPRSAAQGAAAVRGSTVWFKGGSAGASRSPSTGRDPQSGIARAQRRQHRRVRAGALVPRSRPSSIPPPGPRAPPAPSTSAGSSGASTLSVTARDGVGLRSAPPRSRSSPIARAPALTITSPVKQTWLGSDQATVRFTATDAGSGIGTVVARRQRAPLPSQVGRVRQRDAGRPMGRSRPPAATSFTRPASSATPAIAGSSPRPTGWALAIDGPRRPSPSTPPARSWSVSGCPSRDSTSARPVPIPVFASWVLGQEARRQHDLPARQDRGRRTRRGRRSSISRPGATSETTYVG